MFRQIRLGLFLCLSLGTANAITSLNVSVVTKSVVFLFASDSTGDVINDRGGRNRFSNPCA